MGKMNSYLRETIALFKGDTDKVLAEKNYRVATSALDIQIAGCKAELLKREGQLDSAKDALKAAKFPTERISDTTKYLNTIRIAQDEVDTCEDGMKEIEESIQYWESLKEEFSKEVEE